MKRIYSLFLFLSPCLLSISQEVNVFWGKANPYDIRSTTQVVGRKGDLLLGYKRKFKNTSVLKYNFSDLQIKGERPLIGKKNSKVSGKLIDDDYAFEDIYMLKNKTYVCVTKYDKKTDKNSIYMQEIDNEGNLTGSLKKLADISSKSKRRSGTFLVFCSKDSTKILVVNNPPFEKYAGEKFGFKIFNEGLEEIHNLSVELPYKDKDFDAEEYILGNDGNIYLMAQVFLEKRDKKKEEAKYYYQIISVKPTGKGEVTQYEIKLPQKYITDISYRLDDNKIICSGFYGNVESKKDDIKGIFFMRIDKTTKQLEATGIKALEKDFIADLTSRRKADKGRGISSSFAIRDFVKRSDGGAILISEYAYDYVTTVCTTSPKGGTTCNTVYHYVRNNIIAININPDASIKWLANIPKYQHTTNDMGAFNSYMMATKGSEMYFVYNDNPKNLDPEKIKSPKDLFTMNAPRKSIAVLVTLSEDGKHTKKVLFSNKDNKMIIKPASAIKISENEQVVSAMSSGLYCCMIPIKAAKSKLARFEFK